MNYAVVFVLCLLKESSTDIMEYKGLSSRDGGAAADATEHQSDRPRVSRTDASAKRFKFESESAEVSF